MKRMTAGAILLTVATIAACTSTSSSGGSSSGTNGNGINGGGGPNGGDSTNPSNGPSGGTTQKIGSISLSQSSFSAGSTTITSYTAMATFIEATTSGTTTTGGTNPCTQSTEGDCSITACDTSGLSGSDAGGTPADGGGALKMPSAGDITISGAKSVTLSPGGSGFYSPKTEQVALWSDGAQVSVDAKGAEVPAFQKSLTAPAAISLTAPEWPSTPGAALAIDRSQDLAVTWDAGGAGDVQVSITSAAGSKTGMISCKFAASGGSGTITKAALGKLVATATGTISVSAMSSDTVDAGDWKVTVMALAPATTGSGGAASGLANIQ